VKILLDTQVWLWALGEPSRLNAEAQRLLSDPGVVLYLSAASLWEIALKNSLGKLQLPEPCAPYMLRLLKEKGVLVLPVQAAHALHTAALPWHHRDPFDRLLVAQAVCEEMALMTADGMLWRYDVRIIGV
jgi:PIN domain nuclease of toxin-antitoxin system